MAHLPDLSEGGYGGYPGVLSVGWLDAPHPFPTGQSPPRLASRLEELLNCSFEVALTLPPGVEVHRLGDPTPVDRYTLRGPWQPERFMGGHSCTLCRARGTAPAYGYKNLFVPGQGHVFMAPELILHYVEDHGYRPPDAFIDAVMTCPPMRSPQYARLLFEASPGLFPPSGPVVEDGILLDG